MAMIIAPDSAYGRELWRWNNPVGSATGDGPNRVYGMGANGYQPYPAQMYLVTQKNPWKYEGVTVGSEAEQRNLESRGFVAGGLQAACDAFDAAQQALAIAAAERNYADRHLGERARAEMNAAEQASSTHLGEIPETPIRRSPGRPRKVDSVS